MSWPGEALCANVCGATGHSRANALALAVTLSLKLMTMFELTATLVAEFAGVVLVTVGAVSPGRHSQSPKNRRSPSRGRSSVIGILPPEPNLLTGG